MSTPINWNASIQFPTDTCFVNRITKATFAPSSTGNVGITIETEVVTPTTYNVGGQEVNIAGVKGRCAFPFMTKMFKEDGSVDEERTANARARVFVSTNPEQPSLWEKLELDGKKEDPENPNVKQLEGMLVMVQMSSQEDIQRKTPTSEQIAKAKLAKKKPEGDIMKNPKTGKAMCKYWPRVDEIFGLAPKGGLGY
jgi:hypothetical protein